MSGALLQKSIVDEGHRFGWYAVRIPKGQVRAGVFVTNTSGSDNKGFPDLVLYRERIIHVEVKGDGDSLTPDQEEWAMRILEADGEHYVWRPRHWFDGIVHEVLRRGAT